MISLRQEYPPMSTGPVPFHPQLPHYRNSFSQPHGSPYNASPTSAPDTALTSKFQSSLAVPLDSRYMQRAFAASSNPPIHVQQSEATGSASHIVPQIQHSHVQFDEQGQGNSAAAWPQFLNTQRLLPHALGNQHGGASTQRHKRNSSGSTIASNGPSSPFTPSSPSYPHIIDSESHGFASPVEHYDQFSKNDHNTANAAFTDFAYTPDFRAYVVPQQYVDSRLDFRYSARDIMAQQAAEMDGEVALRKTHSGEFSEDLKSAMDARGAVPKLDRTMSDIYQDELYNPNVAIAAPVPQLSEHNQTSQGMLLSPRRELTERLQAANNGHISARSGSPANSMSRERSPFRPTSKYANDELIPNHSNSPGSLLGTAAKLRERQKEEADARAFARHHHSSSLQSTRTISPKEALLDAPSEDEEHMPPLFNTENTAHQSRVDNSFASSSHLAEPANDFHAPVGMPDFALDDHDATSNQQRGLSRQRNLIQNTEQYPFISQPRRQNSNVQSGSDSVPEFPAHLTSMESTRSDTKSTESPSDTSEIRRPSSTTADSGTYSCTYHGCTMRFETPAKLQRHKRDNHRQGSPPIPIGVDASAMRNSQAGPHKCERTNPSTGKPCNSIFSRPYDLTRHEDTIHNAKKQKVKCQFCTEEKTFSRNDALTRHMRVVHPEVDFPGKTKRKM